MGRYKQAPDGFLRARTGTAVRIWTALGDLGQRARLPERTGTGTRGTARWTSWRRRNRKLRAELEAKERENRILKAQNTALHRRQFKPNRRARPAPSPPALTAPKKRGAPFGHPPWSRTAPDHVDETLEVPAPDACPHCGHAPLEPHPEMHDHLQEDIVLKPRTHVTHFRHRQAFCPRCRRPVLRPADGELLHHAIGPVARATALYLRYGLKIPYRGVQKLLADCFGLRFVPATAVRFDRQAVRRGLPLYKDLKAKFQASLVVHADETHWRQDGRSAFLWFGGHADLAVFHLASTRAGDVAVELLGADFPGTLITDDYAGYNAVHARRRQTCWSHLYRKAKSIQEELTLPKAPSAPHAQTFCKRLMRFARLACRLGRWFHAGRFPLSKARSLVPRLHKRLLAFASAPLDYETAETLRHRVTVTDSNRLFTFLTVPGVEPTNNHAEQALRGPVIMRKITFGTRSAAGSLAHGVLPSLLLTAHRQGRDPLQFFRTLFTADTATAQAALYRNPPDTS